MQDIPRNLDSILQAYGPYPLHKAAELGHTKNLIVLLDHGMSPNQTNYDCLTPLHEACIQNKVECAEILINYGAQVNATSLEGGTPLCDACAVGSVTCVELLMKKGAQVNPPLALSTPLHEACLKGSLDCTTRMIRAGARLNANDCNYGTPLHAATIMNHPDCVRLLLQAGAVVNATKIHETALHVAAREGFHEVAEILLEYGGNVYASNNQKKLPIDLVSKQNCRTYNLLKYHSAQPVALKDMCRRKIRAVLGSQRLQFLRNLDLPKCLVKYLMHEEQ